ncbi:hypothetical protein ANN_14991 [Periplaneta americana]|uniref:Uncharacterized protein n=1 Tax=Periplaneta americana TaxID=6978 RepID=A0ABQ8T009_PERAM|nr:hypothetical protein ANN_14991 [Periplaneta americana]
MQSRLCIMSERRGRQDKYLSRKIPPNLPKLVAQPDPQVSAIRHSSPAHRFVPGLHKSRSSQTQEVFNKGTDARRSLARFAYMRGTGD